MTIQLHSRYFFIAELLQSISCGSLLFGEILETLEPVEPMTI